MVGPTIETSRLILRPPAKEDFDGFAAFMADPECTQFLGGTLSREAVWRGFTCLAGAWSVWGFSMFSVIERSSGRWVGRLGPWRPEGWPGNEVGWGISREAWGKGYATEGSIASVDWAFANLGWTDVIHCIDPKNTPSQEVAKRLGAKVRGPGKLPPPHDTANIEIWGQTLNEWRNR